MRTCIHLLLPFMLATAADAAPFDSQPAEVDRTEQLERAKDAKNAVFTALDSNGDDELSKAEAAIELSLSRDFDEFDHNGDGVVSREEYLRERHAEEGSLEGVE